MQRDAKLKRRILRDGLRPDEIRDDAIRRAVRSIPRGSVATYGEVAAAAGYPLYHRLVARILGKAGDALAACGGRRRRHQAQARRRARAAHSP